MNITPDLLALITEDSMGFFGDGTFNQIAKKSVELCPAVFRPGQTTAPEHPDIHIEITAIFLCHDVRSDFRSSEYRVFGMVQGKLFVNAIGKIGMFFIDLPTGFLFNKREKIRVVAVYFIG